MVHVIDNSFQIAVIGATKIKSPVNLGKEQ